jgi:hypothetical protein
VLSASAALLLVGFIVGQGAPSGPGDAATALFRPREALAVEANSGASLIHDHHLITHANVEPFLSFASTPKALVFFTDIVLTNKTAGTITC